MPTVSFSGHETFPFRYGWLKKGVCAVRNNPSFFSSERAMVELGVGKNMVNSIRYWCSAAGLIESAEQKNGASRAAGYKPSDIAESLLLNDGFDPYFEDLASLWLVHWKIATNREQCTTWYWLFNEWHAVEFTKEQIFTEIQKWLEKHTPKPTSEKTLSRDIDVCIRTYVHSRNSKGAISEDTLDCPLTELNLIVELQDGKTYQFTRGEQKTLPDEVFLFALSDFLSKNKFEGKWVGLERIVYDAESPGTIFKLDEESVVRRLEGIEEKSRGIFRYDETAGNKQIRREKEIEPLRWLEQYYRKHLDK